VTVGTSQPRKANVGLAIYVAGAGLAIAFIGSVMLSSERNRGRSGLAAASAEATTKKCPDRAETCLQSSAAAFGVILIAGDGLSMSSRQVEPGLTACIFEQLKFVHDLVSFDDWYMNRW
jgi:hypothetical protein